jgi:hypothetical protein
MKLELFMIAITTFIIANIYSDGKYLKIMLSWKKYYQMVGVAFGAFMLYILIKKNPLRAKEMLTTSNEVIKHLPIDKNTSSIISPILDFTSKQNFGQGTPGNPVIPLSNYSTPQYVQNRVLNSGKNKTKRSVSETKKKFVASRQNWHCKKCNNQLSAWFEVDHVTRLENGGSNHVDNLVALCRECHGEKTAMENL